MARPTPITDRAPSARADDECIAEIIDSQRKDIELHRAGSIEQALSAAAQGYFQLYEPLAELTEARFLNDPTRKTPVFAHFAAGPGPAGAVDALRGACGFRVRFYTAQGHFDLIGSNLAVALTRAAPALGDALAWQEALPFSSGPSPREAFWDYVSSTPETAHGVLWLMSDRALPASYRAMQGFAVQRLCLLNAERKRTWVQFHWLPLSGVYSLVWEEAQQLAATVPDFKRRALWRDIEWGCYPEWELAIQVIGEEDMAHYGFDLWDPTTLVAQELAPLRKVGKLRLNRKPHSAFAEAEQATLRASNLVPGIALDYGPAQAPREEWACASGIPLRRPVVALSDVRGECRRRRGPDRRWSTSTVSTHPSAECFAQANLFWNSLNRHEKDHVVTAYSLALSGVDRLLVRRRQVQAILANIDMTLATRVALNIGVAPPMSPTVRSRPRALLASPALSQANMLSGSIGARLVAVLIADGFDAQDVESIRTALRRERASAVLIGLTGAPVSAADGTVLQPEAALASMPSTLFDALFVPGGMAASQCLARNDDALAYLLEAYKHLKAVALCTTAARLARELTLEADEGLLCGGTAEALASAFMAAISRHRIWSRATAARSIPV
ncbi:MAG TPA: catalase [Pseudomonas sp.]|uniref:catalase n=1 Tax=Pseudomonas sp. TaxID=306 RepID=UPI002C4FED5E|nr:catalase [Pseudomonas sp.]HSX87469.1 catalase [Pseudomonas sp.]